MTAEANLEQQREAEKRNIKTLDAELLGQQQRLADIARLEKTHELTVARLTEMKLADRELAGGAASINVCVLEDPELTNNKIWPRPAQFLPLCGILGLAGGCVAVSLIELSRRRKNTTIA